MRIVFFLLLLAAYSSAMPAQNKNKPRHTVFKVRAPASACSVFPEDTVLWLEKENRIKVKVRSKHENIKVQFSHGKILKKEDDLYTVKFDTSGRTVVTIFEIDGQKSKMIYAKSFKVREPDIYFCGVKVSTISRGLKMKGEHLQAYSIPLDTVIKISSFDMSYYNGISTSTMHSDSSRLSAKMYKIVFENHRFSDAKNSLFFSNISANMPDGSIKKLSPFAVFCERDTTNPKEIQFKFSARKMVLGRDIK